MSELWETLPDKTLQRLRLFGRAQAGIFPVNLYRIVDRKQTLLFIVAAGSSEEALSYINSFGLNWTLGNTITNSIQRNIMRNEGIIDVCELHRFEHLHDHRRRIKNKLARHGEM